MASAHPTRASTRRRSRRVAVMLAFGLVLGAASSRLARGSEGSVVVRPVLIESRDRPYAWMLPHEHLPPTGYRAGSLRSAHELLPLASTTRELLSTRPQTERIAFKIGLNLAAAGADREERAQRVESAARVATQLSSRARVALESIVAELRIERECRSCFGELFAAVTESTQLQRSIPAHLAAGMWVGSLTLALEAEVDVSRYLPIGSTLSAALRASSGTDGDDTVARSIDALTDLVGSEPQPDAVMAAVQAATGGPAKSL